MFLRRIMLYLQVLEIETAFALQHVTEQQDRSFLPGAVVQVNRSSSCGITMTSMKKLCQDAELRTVLME